ncbi:MAG TPA: nuclear transport factor 2 family protein [Solirubrobacterales bacterium]
MTRSRIEIARESIDAWNRRDVEWLVETASPDFEFVPLIASSVEGEAGVVRGSEEFRRFFVELDETWEVFHLETEEMEEVGDAVLVRSHLQAKGRGSGVELDQPLFSLLRFEGDVPVSLQGFADRESALAAAGEEVRG